MPCAWQSLSKSSAQLMIRHRFDECACVCAAVCNPNYRRLRNGIDCLPMFCRGLHFLALQKDEEAEQCAGVWLLQDREPPSI